MDGLIIDPKPDATTPSWLQAAYKLGVPAVIALYLVFQLVDSTKVLAVIDSRVQQHISDTMVLTRLLEEVRQSAIRQEGYLRLVCVHTAKTETETSACLSLR